MSGFITKAACRGRRPSQFSKHNGFQRQDLITRLLKERSVARFVVAPSGYGKTGLAVDYAETVFNWVHTFFVNCQSPCFLRDLDDDSIADACLKQDGDARLAVFDAVPVLETARAERFSREIDALLAAGCEVLVTCTPAADAYGQLQADQVRLGSNDLLLTDEELEATRTADERASGPSALLPAAFRVPALVWGVGPDANASFLKGCLQEPMPADLFLAMASMFVLQRGSLEGLSTLGPIDVRLVGGLLASYPHLGYDQEAGRFEAPPIPADDVAHALKRGFDSLVERSAFQSKHELVMAWADLLMGEGGRADRACDVVRALCPRPQRGAWAAARVADLVRAGSFFPSWMLARSAGMRSVDLGLDDRARVLLLESACRAVLGDGGGAVSCAKRFAFDEGVDPVIRTYGLLIVERYADAGLGERAAAHLEAAAEAAKLAPGRRLDSDALALAWHAARSGSAALADAWAKIRAAGGRDETLCLVASRLFDVVGSEWESAGAAVKDAGVIVEPVERFVRALLESEQGFPEDFFALSAGMAMEHAHVSGMGYDGGPLATKVLVGLRHAEMSILRQRQQFRQEADAEKAKQTALDPGAMGPPASGLQVGFVPKAKRNVPILEVRMFGCFEVSIGDMLLDPDFFRRKGVRSLFVLLAINQGREVSRDVIANAIWPNASPDIARKNFYSVWSQLKRGLSLPDGTCPYLLRRQYGCSLEPRYVHTDIARLVQICRELMFGRPDIDEWSSIYAELDRDFAGELMPSETNNQLVLGARNEYRTRLVDALVAATQRIVDVGSPQWGIWFSRMAIGHEKTREDAYVALMRAQVAADQRTAAIMTFLKCQRVLSEELGVDPSPETMALYESLLD